MRIVIESGEGQSTTVQTSVQPNVVQVADGGQPSQSLLQLIKAASELPQQPELMGAMDGGVPPTWLHEVIEGRISPAVESANEANNAGAAPSAEPNGTGAVNAGVPPRWLADAIAL